MVCSRIQKRFLLSATKSLCSLLLPRTRLIVYGFPTLPFNITWTCLPLRQSSRRVRTSSVGSTTGSSPLPLSAFEAPTSCVAWNARALAHHNSPIRQQKVNEALAFCRLYSVVALLETHGSLLAQHNKIFWLGASRRTFCFVAG